MFSLLILGVLGLMAGSFVNALVWRFHQNHPELELDEEPARLAKQPNLSIIRGRSQCPHCGHQLSALDLVPVLSWLSLGRKCRYCRQPISWHYPLVELATAGLFMVSYLAWSAGVVTPADWLLFVAWLGSAIGLMALLVYDLRWLVLPNKMLYPTLVVAAAGRLFYIAIFAAEPLKSLGWWTAAVLIASGFFWLLFQLSRGQWIGYGDVRLGLITGTLLADPLLALMMIAGAAILGSLIALPLIMTGRRQLSSRIAFGPFLILSAWLVGLLGQHLVDYYNQLVS